MEQDHNVIELNIPRVEGFLAADSLYDRSQIEDEAWFLIQNRDRLDNPEVNMVERRDNARTALMEALTASGHLSRVEICAATLEEINTQVLARLLNGWDDRLHQHEQKRRFAELCNELIIQRTHRAIILGQQSPNTAVLELSDYPEKLIGARLGYRDSNKKGMVRSTHLVRNVDGTYTRVIEQVSRSNSTHLSTARFFSAISVTMQDKEPDLAALEAPLIYSTDSYEQSVVGVMRRLDRLSGVNVLYGDTGDKIAKHVGYDELRDESLRREAEIDSFVDDLAILEQWLDKKLARGDIPTEERQKIFGEQIDRILSAICTLSPDYAEDTYGKKAAPHFYHAADLVAIGRPDLALIHLQNTRSLKETITFCGMEISIEQAKAMGIPVDSYGQLLEKGMKNWKYKSGVCRVTTCDTRPGKTDVGPCSVCINCQGKFDKGVDPTRIDVVSLVYSILSVGTKRKVS